MRAAILFLICLHGITFALGRPIILLQLDGNAIEDDVTPEMTYKTTDVVNATLVEDSFNQVPNQIGVDYLACNLNLATSLSAWIRYGIFPCEKKLAYALVAELRHKKIDFPTAVHYGAKLEVVKFGLILFVYCMIIFVIAERKPQTKSFK